MSCTFFVPRRFDSRYSILGRWLRHRLCDPRQAEAWYLIAVSMLALGFLLTQYLAWALLKSAILAEPGGTVAIAFWLFQIVGLGLCVGGCVVGFAPAITVTCSPMELHLQQGSKTLALSLEDILSAETISGLQFHRHYARYAATQAFVNQVHDEVLLIKTARWPVVLGLAPEDQKALQQHLNDHALPVFSARMAQVA